MLLQSLSKIKDLREKANTALMAKDIQEFASCVIDIEQEADSIGLRSLNSIANSIASLLRTRERIVIHGKEYPISDEYYFQMKKGRGVLIFEGFWFE